MKNKKFSFSNRIKSFKFALNGLRILFLEEHNAWIHAFTTICVIVLGLYFEIRIFEWMFLAITIGMVFMMEIMNTAIENISDFIHPKKHESIKRIKDLAASAVIVSAIVALTIGLFIFIPKL